MFEITDKNKCTGCMACLNVCPKNCISAGQNFEGFIIPVVDAFKCVKCLRCRNVCPINNKTKITVDRTAYAACSDKEEIRLKSSSGGMFSVFAEYVLNQGGVVFGAAYSNDRKRAEHIFVDSVGDLEKLRESKYVQSDISFSFKAAKRFLDDGKNVLFSGTPCQIAGLKSYLKKEYDNLITLDIICHGVPSPKVWKEYVKYKENEYGSRCTAVSVRDKSEGWNKYSYKMEFENGAVFKELARDNYYNKAFLSNIDLRNSCYNCEFKAGKSGSDITLADFWGIEEICSDMNDNKGTSLILINTVVGQKIFVSIKEDIKYEVVDFEIALSQNQSYYVSAKKNKKRKKFFKSLDKNGVKFSMEKYTRSSCLHKIKRFVKRILVRS